MNHLYLTRKERKAIILLLTLLSVIQLLNLLIKYQNSTTNREMKMIMVNHDKQVFDTVSVSNIDFENEPKPIKPIKVKEPKVQTIDITAIKAPVAQNKLKPTTDKLAIVIELNSASPEDLKTLKGLGPVLSSRIVKYRDMVGGFHSKEQLKEVYGLRTTLVDSLSSQLMVNKSILRKLNVFTASEEQLSQQYFISKYLAQKIKRLIDSRYTQIDSKETFIKLLNYDPVKLEKVLPYLCFEKPADKD